MARRLFVALAPPETTRERLVAAAAGLRQALGPAARQLRWSAPDTFHLTLRFLGEVEEGRTAAVAGAVGAAAAASRRLALAVRGAGAFPSARHPRAVFLGLEGELPPLQALVAGLEARLAEAGFPPEPRPFRPHLTVARARDRRAPPGLEGALLEAAATPIPWPAEAVTLFESHLSGGGVRHEPVLVAPLGAAVG
jgi:2'-5' RNA ligase